MKKWQAALLSLVTFIIGGSGGLITEEQSSQLLTSLSEQFIAQGGGKSNPETLEKVNRGLQS
jgi:hypothetical protein